MEKEIADSLVLVMMALWGRIRGIPIQGAYLKRVMGVVIAMNNIGSVIKKIFALTAVIFLFCCGSHERISSVRSYSSKSEYIIFLNNKLERHGFVRKGETYWENGREKVSIVNITDVNNGLIEVTLNIIEFKKDLDFFIPESEK